MPPFYLARVHKHVLTKARREKIKEQGCYELHPLYFYLICALLRGLSEKPTHWLLINGARAGGEDAGPTVMHVHGAGGWTGCDQAMWVREHLASTLTYLRMCEYPVLRAASSLNFLLFGLDNAWEASQDLHSCCQEGSGRPGKTRFLPSIPMFMLFM